jgi:cellulose biosynthesis protein BcsQ
MNVVTVFNNKGGVGKTTLLCNLASYLARSRLKKVLVVDADPQCNATIYTLPESAFEPIYEQKQPQTIQAFVNPLKKGRGYSDNSFKPIRSARFGFDVVPGDPALALSEDLLAADWKSAIGGDPRGLQTTFVFEDLFSRFTEYDYVFVDVSPSLGAINRSVLLASDFFMMPMSSDIFSLMAVKNIALAMSRWRRDLEKALQQYQQEEGEPFSIGDRDISWRLKFCGYVTQQYTAKAVRGVREPVKAYDRIIKKMGPTIRKEIVERFDQNAKLTYQLGSIPNLNSIIPLSQNANAPIFDLGGSDGVVGAHFEKVRDARILLGGLANSLEANLKALGA